MDEKNNGCVNRCYSVSNILCCAATHSLFIINDSDEGLCALTSLRDADSTMSVVVWGEVEGIVR